jgi:hypothetical protein
VSAPKLLSLAGGISEQPGTNVKHHETASQPQELFDKVKAQGQI